MYGLVHYIVWKRTRKRENQLLLAMITITGDVYEQLIKCMLYLMCWYTCT